MNLTGDILRGHTDAIILSVLEREDSYGYKINFEVDQLSENQFRLTEATLYTSFKRLESQEFIVSYLRDGLNNTKRKYYSITEKGRMFLNEHRKTWSYSKKIIDKLLGGQNGK